MEHDSAKFCGDFLNKSELTEVQMHLHSGTSNFEKIIHIIKIQEKKIKMKKCVCAIRKIANSLYDGIFFKIVF